MSFQVTEDEPGTLATSCRRNASVVDSGRESSSGVMVMVRSRSLACEDELRAHLADHDGGRVGVAAGDRRHDRGVADPQPLDAADLEVGADDRELVDAHPAGADAVVD